MVRCRRWMVAALMLAACECSAAQEERMNEPMGGPTEVGEPMIGSEWVQASAPPDLLPLTTEPYVVHADDPAQLRIEKDGEPVHVFEESGELACASREGWLACSLRGDEVCWVPVFDPSGAIHNVRVSASFFDDRRVEGPPRWTADGALWLRYGGRWERRPVIRVEPPDRDALAAARERLRTKLPETGHTFEPVEGRAVPALWSEPLDREAAYALYDALDVDGLSRAVVTEALVSEARRDGAWALRFAEQVPVGAVFAQLETGQLAFHAAILDDIPEPYRYANQKALARIREGQRPPVPANLEPESLEPTLPFDPSSMPGMLALPQPTLRVLVVEGGDELLPIAAGFGAFNNCPSPGEHAVILADWRERYGARVRFMDHATLELIVIDPPADQVERYELGYRMVVYDPDLETVASAARMVGGRRWSFWWD